MNCASLERRLERLAAGELSIAEREAAAEHVSHCSSCRDLLELARIATGVQKTLMPPANLTDRVLAETAGSACHAAERALCDLVDGRLDGDDAELVRGHLAACSECAALERAVDSLVVELPRMADIRPDRRFVAAVLAATLPWQVRARRWWQRSWPRWVRRPRFALEAAYAATLVLVVLFTTPVSPLEAMPRRAVEIVQTVPAPKLGGKWARFEADLAARLESVGRSEGTRAVIDGWRETIEVGEKTLRRAQARTRSTSAWAISHIRTFWEELASLLERADADPAAAAPDSDEETS